MRWKQQQQTPPTLIRFSHFSQNGQKHRKKKQSSAAAIIEASLNPLGGREKRRKTSTILHSLERSIASSTSLLPFPIGWYFLLSFSVS